MVCESFFWSKLVLQAQQTVGDHSSKFNIGYTNTAGIW